MQLQNCLVKVTTQSGYPSLSGTIKRILLNTVITIHHPPHTPIKKQRAGTGTCLLVFAHTCMYTASYGLSTLINYIIITMKGNLSFQQGISYLSSR